MPDFKKPWEPKKIEMPFIGGAYTGRSKDLNAQVCQNYYVEIDKTGAKNLISLTGTPGLLEWLDLSDASEIRTFHIFLQNLYVVCGNTVYKVTSAKGKTNIGTIGTSDGWCNITSDGVNMAVFDSTGGWTWDDTTFSNITAAGFPDPSGATYQDGYHIVARAGTDQFNISTADNPTEWDATDFANAEGDGDILILPKSVKRQLWLFGERSTEIYYNSGASFPFARNPGGFLRIGLGAKRSVAEFDGALLWLDDKYRVIQSLGLGYKPVSTYQIDYQISLMASKTDAVGFCYSSEGHVFYELTFPDVSDNKTLCYDLTVGPDAGWHTRASGENDLRERANCYIFFADKHLVGDFENGIIYEYDLGTYSDNGTVKRAIRTCQPVHSNRQNIFFNNFELDFETGVGIATGQGSDPQVMLQYSDDGGHTWSSERWRSIGKAGEYSSRVRWNRLGKSRNRIFRVVISDPVKRKIINAYLDGIVGVA